MLTIRENKNGLFFVENFGQNWGGPKGKEFFPLRIESKKFDLILEVEDATVFDLDPKLKVNSREFRENRIFLTDLIRIKKGVKELTLEVAHGSLYDLIKERVAEGGAKISSELPISVYYRGLLEAA